MFITFDVSFPTPHSIPAAKLAIFEQVLPARSPVQVTGEEEECVLGDVDYARQQKQQQNEEDDEQQQQGGAPGVQCQQQ